MGMTIAICNSFCIKWWLHWVIYDAQFLYINKAELKVGHTCWPIWPTGQSGCDPHMTHMLKFFNVANVTWHKKILIWNNVIDFFILGRIQNWSFAQTSWRWNLWTPHASKQLEIKISWFYTNDISVHSSDPKFTHLYQIPTLFSKKHVISGSHSDNLVCGWDPLDPPKRDLSDPDCPGHQTHFQPWNKACNFTLRVYGNDYRIIQFLLFKMMMILNHLRCSIHLYK